ncbi:sensor domain-containing protein [Streptomyces sp. 21So2-11]|uniref:sensor histidine kinase n=1 Tax=Streptomyces sp. 21So2-11 TaxID=3144408 RepID=UPI0032194A39
MRIHSTLVAGARGLGLALAALAGSLALIVLSLVSLILTVVGVGIWTTPVVLSWVRGFADYRRVWAHAWTGVVIPTSHRPPPPGPGLVGRVRYFGALMRDPATWREQLWLWADAFAGYLVALLPAALLVYGAAGFLLPLLYWLSGQRGKWYGFWLLDLSHPGVFVTMPVLGAGLLLLARGANPALLRAHFRMAAAFLAPPRTELAERVAYLTESRHDAVDASAAEMRRIERDLHDGAQARLVAMGMNLHTVDVLIEKDPARAREMLAAARRSSAEALTELRDLVRGIHPPVLAERGLGDAVRALALRMPLPVGVRVETTGRAEAPVETAVYFAISELLTNAAKHSGAGRIDVEIRYEREHDRGPGRLVAEVSDNGRGGAADPAGSGAAGRESTGLAGVQRRLGTFDGTLVIDSPVGGPTRARIDVPCLLVQAAPAQDQAGS